MKRNLVDFQRVVTALGYSAEANERSNYAFHYQASSIVTECEIILDQRRGLILPQQWDELYVECSQLLALPVAFLAAFSGRAGRLLLRTTNVNPSPFTDRRERCFDESNLQHGSKLKVVCPRTVKCEGHRRPLRARDALGSAGCRLSPRPLATPPSADGTLHVSCVRTSGLSENTHQILQQTSGSALSCNLCQQVAGHGESSAESCQQAPLRNVHEVPSTDFRSLGGGKPPRGCGKGWGSKGRVLPAGRRFVSDYVAPVIMLLALCTFAIPLDRKVSSLSSPRRTGFGYEF
jgi:hypothetical protein